MSAQSISRDVIPWQPRADIKSLLARIPLPMFVGFAAIMTYGAAHFVSTLPRFPVTAYSPNIAIPQSKAPIPEMPPVEIAPPAKSVTVNAPPVETAAPAQKPVTINVPPQDIVIVAVPPSNRVVINDQTKTVDVPRKLTVAARKSAGPLVRSVRHASAPHVRHHRVLVEEDVEPVRHIVREPHLREVTALAPRPVPTPGLFPLPLKIFLADMFGGPRP